MSDPQLTLRYHEWSCSCRLSLLVPRSPLNFACSPSEMPAADRRARLLQFFRRRRASRRGLLLRPFRADQGSIELEGRFVVLAELGILILLAQDAIADGEHFDIRPHEAAEGIFGSADDRLATDV